MKEYKRAHPSFSLCGLNCALCPRHHTDGSSRCPGCGGDDFALLHPSCAVITCSARHGNVEFCFECATYPCERYTTAGSADSFIAYRNVLSDNQRAAADLNGYMADMESKRQILCELILKANDGKSKAFFCLAVNLLPLTELEAMMVSLREILTDETLSSKVKAGTVTTWMKKKAESLQINLALRH